MSDMRGRWKRTEEHRQRVSEHFKDFYKKNPNQNRCSDRTKALEEGRKFYISPTPCKKCGGVIKFVSTYGCHYCVKKAGYEKLMSGALEVYKTPDKKRERVRRWRENNYDKFQQQWLREPAEKKNSRAAKRRARKLNQTPDLTQSQKDLIMGYYLEAKRLTEETGIPHEVDHIIPICKGGLHHPDNLQVLTKEENRKKGGR